MHSCAKLIHRPSQSQGKRLLISVLAPHVFIVLRCGDSLSRSESSIRSKFLPGERTEFLQKSSTAATCGPVDLLWTSYASRWMLKSTCDLGMALRAQEARSICVLSGTMFDNLGQCWRCECHWCPFPTHSPHIPHEY